MKPGELDRRAVVAGLGASAAFLGLGGLAGCSSGSAEPGAALGSEASGTSSGPAAATRPNVLYITADDLGTRLGSYDHPRVVTPRLDAFAAEAVQFDRCYCQIAICTASRSSILTGIRPETVGFHGIDDQWQELAPGARSLFRNFRDSGYRTYGVGKIRDPRGGDHDDAWDDRTFEGQRFDIEGVIDMLGRVAAADQNQPFCAAIGFHEPHCPWEPSAEALAQYDPVGFEPESNGRTAAEQQTECMGIENSEMSDEDAAFVSLQYLASVTDVDTKFGLIQDAAAELGLLENTIIIFWSGDHGFSLGENNLYGKWSLSDAATRIPLIMQLPGMTNGGTRVPRLVEAVDMYPTLIELCDLETPPQELEGLSFVPLFTEPERAWKRAAFVAWISPGPMGVKTEQYSFHDKPTEFFDELYDLTADPDETTNLVNDLPEVRAEMLALREAGWRGALPE